MARHDRGSFPERVDFLNGPGFLDGGTSRTDRGLPEGGPKLVLSPFGVFDFEPVSKRMRIVSLNPGITVEQVQKQTGFELLVEGTPPVTGCHPPTNCATCAKGRLYRRAARAAAGLIHKDHKKSRENVHVSDRRADRVRRQHQADGRTAYRADRGRDRRKRSLSRRTGPDLRRHGPASAMGAGRIWRARRKPDAALPCQARDRQGLDGLLDPGRHRTRSEWRCRYCISAPRSRSAGSCRCRPREER